MVENASKWEQKLRRLTRRIMGEEKSSSQRRSTDTQYISMVYLRQVCRTERRLKSIRIRQHESKSTASRLAGEFSGSPERSCSWGQRRLPLTVLGWRRVSPSRPSQVD